LAPQSSRFDLPRHEVKNLLVMAALGGLPKYPDANVLTSVRREALQLFTLFLGWNLSKAARS
jgi:hypothetical protein